MNFLDNDWVLYTLLLLVLCGIGSCAISNASITDKYISKMVAGGTL